jgi:glutamine amidotransferase
VVSIIDYDAGNIRSVEKAVSHLGHECTITSDPGVILASDHVILPGVGAFSDAMSHLSERGLCDVVRDVTAKGIPFLGICLGLQLLFDDSEESPGCKGLSILPGSIRRIPSDGVLKVPQIGWNDLKFPRKSRLFEGLDEGTFVYFVHSYYLEAANKSDVSSVADYGVQIHSSVEHDNIFATQFHPEKSGDAGLRILSNFLRIH